jgi:hypothetical protein
MASDTLAETKNGTQPRRFNIIQNERRNHTSFHSKASARSLMELGACISPKEKAACQRVGCAGDFTQ